MSAEKRIKDVFGSAVENIEGPIGYEPTYLVVVRGGFKADQIDTMDIVNLKLDMVVAKGGNLEVWVKDMAR